MRQHRPYFIGSLWTFTCSSLRLPCSLFPALTWPSSQLLNVAKIFICTWLCFPYLFWGHYTLFAVQPQTPALLYTLPSFTCQSETSSIYVAFTVLQPLCPFSLCISWVQPLTWTAAIAPWLTSLSPVLAPSAQTSLCPDETCVAGTWRSWSARRIPLICRIRALGGYLLLLCCGLLISKMEVMIICTLITLLKSIFKEVIHLHGSRVKPVQKKSYSCICCTQSAVPLL